MRPAAPLSDTSAEALAAQLACIRRMRPLERFRAGCALTARGRRLAMEALRRRYPMAGADEIRLRYMGLAYGDELAENVGRWLEERRRE